MIFKPKYTFKLTTMEIKRVKKNMHDACKCDMYIVFFYIFMCSHQAFFHLSDCSYYCSCLLSVLLFGMYKQVAVEQTDERVRGQAYLNGVKENVIVDKFEWACRLYWRWIGWKFWVLKLWFVIWYYKNVN